VPIPIRTRSEMDAIARAGELAARAIRAAADAVRPGITTAELDALAGETVLRGGGEAVFRGVRAKGDRGRPFPGAACVSVNEVLVHGLPGARALEPGDLVTIDVGVRLADWCADAAWTCVVPGGGPGANPGSVAERGECLREAARTLTGEAIAMIRPGLAWSAVSGFVEARARALGCALAPGFAGHGVGRALHEPPRAKLESPAVQPGSADDFTLRPGMVLTVEPIVVELGSGGEADEAVRCVDLADGWSVASADGRWGCYEERTVGVVRGSGGARVLTPGAL